MTAGYRKDVLVETALQLLQIILVQHWNFKNAVSLHLFFVNKEFSNAHVFL